ncbi:MAG: transcription termination/antitermination protein NusA [Actinobacteria bacterium RBG_19FT_COMBO_54_7]|nr:MAG: transcription termination/antitermination protein NusA [Actinobacteria bacterium RBG_19FT_COMBO_54_7]
MNLEWLEALRQIEREKCIDSETIIQALEAALLSAYKKNYTTEEEARVEVNRETGTIHVYAEVAGEDGEAGETEVTPKNFGRIAAQTAKQVILQRIREAERDLMFEEYHEKVGDIVTGIVQQSDQRYTLVDLGKVEALLPVSEQIHGERYKHGMRLKVYIVEVRKTSKGPQILVSRTHPGLLKRLFELEVPEIADGYVEIKAVAREPGHRSKIAVLSNDRNIDPVGACVGARGSRVRMVVNELKGEKVDITPWSEDPKELVSNALSPAKVKEVIIHGDEELAEVIVPDGQLSLAIGKEGQNARLAAKLTGWRIDIKSESQAKDEREGYSVPKGDGGDVWVAISEDVPEETEEIVQPELEEAEETVEEIAEDLSEEGEEEPMEEIVEEIAEDLSEEPEGELAKEEEAIQE